MTQDKKQWCPLVSTTKGHLIDASNVREAKAHYSDPPVLASGEMCRVTGQ